MVIDFTPSLAPFLWGLVVLLAISAGAIVAIAERSQNGVTAITPRRPRQAMSLRLWRPGLSPKPGR